MWYGVFHIVLTLLAISLEKQALGQQQNDTENAGQDEYIHTSEFDLISPKAGHPVPVSDEDVITYSRTPLSLETPYDKEIMGGIDIIQKSNCYSKIDQFFIDKILQWSIQDGLTYMKQSQNGRIRGIFKVYTTYEHDSGRPNNKIAIMSVEDQDNEIPLLNTSNSFNQIIYIKEFTTHTPTPESPVSRILKLTEERVGGSQIPVRKHLTTKFYPVSLKGNAQQDASNNIGEETYSQESERDQNMSVEQEELSLSSYRTHPRSDSLIQERHILQRELPSINGVDTASEDKSEPMEDYSLLGDLPLWQIQAEVPLLQGRDQVNCDPTNDAYLKQNGGYLTKFLFTLSKEGEEQINNPYEASNKEEDKMSTQATPDEEFGGHSRSRVRRHSKKKKGGYGMGMMTYQMMPQVIHVNLQISHAPSCGCGCGGCYQPPPPPPPHPCGQCGCGGCRPVCNVCNG
uniref:Uncharacterized protein n=1 Tax=Timema monikensis TaxID=170555 RepID=A0A7R9EG34_9NEOP|nr:unnamed protein product [Timema monikensis]